MSWECGDAANTLKFHRSSGGAGRSRARHGGGTCHAGRMAELNGRPVTVAELQTLALTTYGSFTSLRVDAGRVRGLSLHLERLVRDTKALFGVELDTERVRMFVRRVAPLAGAATIRVTVFDPSMDLGHPDRAADPQVLVTQRPANALPLPPLAVQSTVYGRDMPEVKSVSLFGSLRHRRNARLDGYDDALFTDARGVISEGCTWNVGFFDGTDVLWPEADVLPGVTMQILQQAHPYRSTRITLAELSGMAAAFATNAAIGVRVITLIDDVELPADPSIVQDLRELYTTVPGEPI